MSSIINVYCDESCHLLSDGNNCMVLGSLFVPYEQISAISNGIKEIKSKHGMDIHNELKWVKISNNKIELYQDIIKLFLSTSGLSYRCVVVPDKSLLNHKAFNRSHEKFYYVMYYYCLRFWMHETNSYNIYFDYKEANQQPELLRLRRVLSKASKVSEDRIKTQTIQSYESQLLQLCDLLTGAVAYQNRGLSGSKAKLSILGLLEKSIKRGFRESSPVREEKFNVLIWKPRQGR
ncbi:MAG TPA: DUF3800 domain-containing protein [Candidatus Cloacimonadota bacterium]|nr:DUF3800 domain-containing protein [Candidatus Cloacimonadota bacterium]